MIFGFPYGRSDSSHNPLFRVASLLGLASLGVFMVADITSPATILPVAFAVSALATVKALCELALFGVTVYLIYQGVAAATAFFCSLLQREFDPNLRLSVSYRARQHPTDDGVWDYRFSGARVRVFDPWRVTPTFCGSFPPPFMAHGAAERAQQDFRADQLNSGQGTVRGGAPGAGLERRSGPRWW